jgi:hypothetical protein
LLGELDIRGYDLLYIRAAEGQQLKLEAWLENREPLLAAHRSSSEPPILQLFKPQLSQELKGDSPNANFLNDIRDWQRLTRDWTPRFVAALPDGKAVLFRGTDPDTGETVAIRLENYAQEYFDQSVREQSQSMMADPSIATLSFPWRVLFHGVFDNADSMVSLAKAVPGGAQGLISDTVGLYQKNVLHDPNQKTYQPRSWLFSLWPILQNSIRNDENEGDLPGTSVAKAAVNGVADTVGEICSGLVSGDAKRTAASLTAILPAAKLLKWGRRIQLFGEVRLVAGAEAEMVAGAGLAEGQVVAAFENAVKIKTVPVQAGSKASLGLRSSHTHLEFNAGGQPRAAYYATAFGSKDPVGKGLEYAERLAKENGAARTHTIYLNDREVDALSEYVSQPRKAFTCTRGVADALENATNGRIKIPGRYFTPTLLDRYLTSGSLSFPVVTAENIPARLMAVRLARSAAFEAGLTAGLTAEAGTVVWILADGTQKLISPPKSSPR